MQKNAKRTILYIFGMQKNPILFATESERHIVWVRKMNNKIIFNSMMPEEQYGKCKKEDVRLSDSMLTEQAPQSLQTLQSLQNVQNMQSASLILTPLDQWHDNYEVMEMFHISQRTLQTLRSNGKLPFAKMGGRCYYKESDLQKLLEDSYRDSRMKPIPESCKKQPQNSCYKNGDIEKGGTPCL